MEVCMGLKRQGPRVFASNSTVMVRLASTCVLAVTWGRLRPRSPMASTLMPVSSQMAW
jgi:hypothetical protein